MAHQPAVHRPRIARRGSARTPLRRAALNQHAATHPAGGRSGHHQSSRGGLCLLRDAAQLSGPADDHAVSERSSQDGLGCAGHRDRRPDVSGWPRKLQEHQNRQQEHQQVHGGDPRDAVHGRVFDDARSVVRNRARRSSGRAGRIRSTTARRMFTASTITRELSRWRIEAPSQLYYPAIKGSVWIDKETSRVLRIEQQGKGMPALFPFDTIEASVDYDFIRLGTSGPYLIAGRIRGAELPAGHQHLLAQQDRVPQLSQVWGRVRHHVRQPQ